MSEIELIPWDSSEYLETEEEIEIYFEVCKEDNDPAFLAHALGVIARARAINALSIETGVPRSDLFRYFSGRLAPAPAVIDRIVTVMHLDNEHDRDLVTV